MATKNKMLLSAEYFHIMSRCILEGIKCSLVDRPKFGGCSREKNGSMQKIKWFG